MKQIILILALSLCAAALKAQSIKKKDRWGDAAYYIEGNVLKVKDKWGDALYYFDGKNSKA